MAGPFEHSHVSFKQLLPKVDSIGRSDEWNDLFTSKAPSGKLGAVVMQLASD